MAITGAILLLRRTCLHKGVDGKVARQRREIKTAYQSLRETGTFKP
jgi:hypothetical protein